MISHEKKYLFIRVFKTGTKSMASTLLEYDPSSMSLHCDRDRFFSKPETGGYSKSYDLPEGDSERIFGPKKGMRGSIYFESHHTKASWFKEKLFPREGWHWDKYFKFGFVRNPWDRELSNYFFENPEDDAASANYSFKDYLSHSLVEEVRNSNTPQCEYITDLDYIARFENYEEEVKYLLDKIGVSLGDSEPKHLHKTNHEPYWEYYDDDDIEKVGDWYKKDIDMFNYKFGE